MMIMRCILCHWTISLVKKDDDDDRSTWLADGYAFAELQKSVEKHLYAFDIFKNSHSTSEQRALVKHYDA